ncbi:MAG: hypothetical protein H7211_02470, partial [Aquabacterium sp.]|nr:hypothetical protein [Ferruginibacter sp.]
FIIAAGTLSKTGALATLRQWVAYFKSGHDKIFLLYPGLNENPLKLAGYDVVKLNNVISKYLERSPNEYLQKELDNGLFKDAAVVAEFIQNTLEIFSPVALLFPTLIPAPKS